MRVATADNHTWFDAQPLRSIDVAFAEFIAGHESTDQELMGKVAALMSFHTGQQHVCLPLSEMAKMLLSSEADPVTEAKHCSMLQALVSTLASANTVCLADSLAANQLPSQPLVLDNEKLYLQRYWVYETQLARQLLAMAAQPNHDFGATETELLQQLFTDSAPGQVDWQQVAVVIAAIKPLTLITGGPGTGKTTTVARLLALLQGAHYAVHGRYLRIKLAAPTGKAAARLSESIQGAKSRLPDELSRGLPNQCETIHRLLGPKSNSPYFKHDCRHPLRLDVLVLDEASMVDLPLMAKLVDAMPPHGRLIMLGDQDQLASVEVGSVLGDLCQGIVQGAFNQEVTQLLTSVTGTEFVVTDSAISALQNNRVALTKSHRFDVGGGIGQLAKAVNQQNMSAVISLLTSPPEGLHWHPQATVEQLLALLKPVLQSYFAAVEQGNLSAAFALLSKQQVLCAHKSGNWGVEGINQRVYKALVSAGLVQPGSDLYPGRPIMVTQNDPRLRLFNGDIGLLMKDDKGILKAWFIGPDGLPFNVLPSRLPQHETVYAMTIHKSQGSEFEQVFMCLPEKGGDGLLSTELLYTGLTRAKKSFSLFASQKMLASCLASRCVRGSGLGQRLRQ